jgi:hypothetical protein
MVRTSREKSKPMMKLKHDDHKMSWMVVAEKETYNSPQDELTTKTLR